MTGHWQRYTMPPLDRRYDLEARFGPATTNRDPAERGKAPTKYRQQARRHLKERATRYGCGMPRRKRKEIGAVPTAKPQSSDQAPGEEVVQVNDRYKRRAAAPDMTQEEQAQHQTGG